VSVATYSEDLRIAVKR